MSDPPPATEWITPATRETPAAMARSRADTNGQPTVNGVELTRTAQVLAAALGGAGGLPVARPRTYEWLVPPERGDARGWVHASGVAEIVTAGLMTVPTTRRAGGW